MLKKLNVIALTLGAVLAFGAVMATSAFATPEWLWKGAQIGSGEELSIETTGTLTLIHLEKTIFSPEVVIKCPGTFDGVVLSAGKDLVAELLNLKGEKIELGLRELSCEAVKGCESSSDTFVTAENLPWATQLTLDSPNGANLYLDLFFQEAGSTGLPAYEIDCLIAGALQEALCEGETSADITLNGPTLEGIFLGEELELEGLEGLCESPDFTNVALQEGTGAIIPAGGPELDVSG